MLPQWRRDSYAQNSSLFKRLSDATTEQSTVRVIIFSLGVNTSSVSEDYLFALPVGAVLKVIVCPPIQGVVESGIGMVDLGSKTVTVVDLRQNLPANLQGQDKGSLSGFKSSRFLILLQTQNGECGIPIEQPPALTDIPLTTIRSVPLSYRQATGLSFASHMAILPEAQGQEPLNWSLD